MLNVVEDLALTDQPAAAAPMTIAPCPRYASNEPSCARAPARSMS